MTDEPEERKETMWEHQKRKEQALQQLRGGLTDERLGVIRRILYSFPNDCASELLAEVDRLKTELTERNGELDSIARAIYPHKDWAFTYAVPFAIEEIRKLRAENARLRESRSTPSHVLGLPCICDTPELHSEKCVRLRMAFNAINDRVVRGGEEVEAKPE